MRHYHLLACVALVLLNLVVTSGAAPAPQFSLPDMQGQNVALEALKGKVVYLDFWASWCVPCKQSFPWMNELRKTWDSADVAVIAINLDKKEGPVRGFLDKNPADFTVLRDPAGAMAEAYKVKGMPSTFLIDKQGNIVYSQIGFRESDKAVLLEKIKELTGKK